MNQLPDGYLAGSKKIRPCCWWWIQVVWLYAAVPWSHRRIYQTVTRAAKAMGPGLAARKDPEAKPNVYQIRAIDCTRS
jgi:hypothetical protein